MYCGAGAGAASTCKLRHRSDGGGLFGRAAAALEKGTKKKAPEAAVLARECASTLVLMILPSGVIITNIKKL